MPLSSEDATSTTAGQLVQTLKAVFGTPGGYRPAHAKGRIANGSFTPTPEASSLTFAKNFSDESTPILARFSNSTGIPVIPDNDPNSSPRGFALRFLLGGRKHTDIVAHSTPFFPVKTGEDFLGLLQAQIATASPENKDAHPSPIEQFLGSHPETLAFLQAPKPVKESFAGLSYFGVNAYKLVSSDGNGTFIRYRIIPTLDLATLSEDDLKDKSPDFLFSELESRLASGPVEFKLVAQIAQEGDQTNDATVQWPDDRKIVELGTIKLDSLEAEDKSNADQKYLIFDSVPRVDGIESSDDPLIDVRADIYLISGRERRAA